MCNNYYPHAFEEPNMYCVGTLPPLLLCYCNGCGDFQHCNVTCQFRDEGPLVGVSAVQSSKAILTKKLFHRGPLLSNEAYARV